MFSIGMAARLSEHSQPSIALLERHIWCWMMRDLDSRYLAAWDPESRCELALAGFATLALWLAWLRCGECFGLNWSDLHVTEPRHGLLHGPPQGCSLVDIIKRFGNQVQTYYMGNGSDCVLHHVWLQY
jgi:hypothetical protein